MMKAHFALKEISFLHFSTYRPDKVLTNMQFRGTDKWQEKQGLTEDDLT